MKKVKNHIKRKKRFSYLSAILSISMVLFMLGVFGILFIQSNKMGIYIKENMAINVFLADEITFDEIKSNQEKITNFPFTKSVIYVSKEQAAKDFSTDLGQDFVTFLGYNPLMPSFQIKIKAQDNQSDKLAEIGKVLKMLPKVTEVSYQKNVFEQAEHNLQTLGSLLIALAIVFSLIAMVLINNTVRLNLYAQRFIIKSMQLVGAEHWFIIKPFVWQSIKNGIWGWLLALLLLSGALRGMSVWIPGIEDFYDNNAFMILFSCLLLIGVLISFISSIMSIKRYINTKIDDLY